MGILDRSIDVNANIDPSKIAGGGMGLTPVAKTYYVDRNTGSTGDGLTWDSAFLTIGEAIAQVNADYTASTNDAKSSGRMRRIIISEGWYIEVPTATNLVLTANDVHIIGVAPGHHDATVLYGSSVAGTATVTAGFPALRITGSNNTIENLGIFTWDPLHGSLRIGANASDPDSPTASAPTGNKVINCSFVRDQADGSDGGILSYGADGTLIQGCFFSTSCKDYGVSVLTNGVVNPVNTSIIGCDFVGTETGIILGATAHNTLIKSNIFRDDSSDRDDTITTAVNNSGDATTTVCIDNSWAFSDADAVITNAAMMANNHQLTST